MRLSKTALLVIKGSSDCKKRLSEEMNISDNTIWRWLSENEENGNLTKAIALKIIIEETGLREDQLLDEVQTESQN